MKLENWTLVETQNDPYKPKNQYDYRLKGVVFGHDRFDDGESNYTSRITGKKENLNMIVTSSGSVFELGEPNKKYAKKNPDAKEKLFEMIK